MGAVPAFELVSAPVRFDVVRTMDIRLVAKKPVRLGTETTLSEVLELVIENRGTDPRPVSGAEVTIQVLQPGGATAFFSSLERIAPRIERKQPPLAGGARRTWAGAKAWAELSDVRLTVARPGSFTVVAHWAPTGQQARYRSAPLRIDVRGE
ncbi:MAG: hypothetical protein P1V36_02690 [Planctomycetota bacterium]|nr:hypothetical protein [Planctomycetota bacterium]